MYNVMYMIIMVIKLSGSEVRSKNKIEVLCMDIDTILKKAFEDMMISKINYYDDISSEKNKNIYERNLVKYEKLKNWENKSSINKLDINKLYMDKLGINKISVNKLGTNELSVDELETEEIHLANLWTKVVTESNLLETKGNLSDELIYNLKKILYDLLLIRNKIGSEFGGFENYSDILRRRVGYGRREIRIFRSYVKEKYKNKLNTLDKFSIKATPKNLEDILLDLTLDEFLIETRIFFKGFDQRLYDVFKFMHDNSLFRLENREFKAPAEFTTILPISKLPIIYGTYKNTALDLETMSHEFGHAIQMYLCRDEDFDVIIPSMDVCELSSAFLEICLDEYYIYMLGERGFNCYTEIKRREIYETIIWAAEVDEFQEWLYSTEFSSFEDFLDADIDTRFLLQSHIYREPFYYIEYALAYDIALEELEKKYDHIEKFLEIAKMGGRFGFEETLRRLKIGSHILSMWNIDWNID